MTQQQREHKEAKKKLMNTRWKTEPCTSGGTKCWCRLIVPVKKIVYSEIEEMYVVGSGTMDKATAQYIVKLHNEHLKNK